MRANRRSSRFKAPSSARTSTGASATLLHFALTLRYCIGLQPAPSVEGAGRVRIGAMLVVGVSGVGCVGESLEGGVELG